MRITSHTDYALRTLIYLAAHPQERVPTRDVAGVFDISLNHLLKVVHRLGALGYVEVVRGKGGGMQLMRHPGTIRVGDVVRDFEPDLNLVECFDTERNQCLITPACSLQGTLRDATEAFLEVLDGQTIEDVVQSRRRALRRLLRPA